jgi:hypothetical protein
MALPRQDDSKKIRERASRKGRTQQDKLQEDAIGKNRLWELTLLAQEIKAE